MPTRPVAAVTEDTTTATEVALGFAARLEHALDAGDAAGFDDGFAADVLWGSPFGAVVEGHDAIAAIHAGMIHPPPPEGPAGGGSRYEVAHSRRVADDVVVAYVRRLRRDGPPEHPGLGAAGAAADFDEIALFVLVRRDGEWWLAAGQHVPDRRIEVYGEAL